MHGWMAGRPVPRPYPPRSIHQSREEPEEASPGPAEFGGGHATVAFGEHVEQRVADHRVLAREWAELLEAPRDSGECRHQLIVRAGGGDGLVEFDQQAIALCREVEAGEAGGGPRRHGPEPCTEPEDRRLPSGRQACPALPDEGCVRGDQGQYGRLSSLVTPEMKITPLL